MRTHASQKSQIFNKVQVIFKPILIYYSNCMYVCLSYAHNNLLTVEYT